jgi:hypothetical protein
MVCVSTNHIPHHPGARYLPVVWCNLKIHSFSKNQSRVVKGQADWEKFFEQVGANEIRSCWWKTSTAAAAGLIFGENTNMDKEV